MFVVGRRVGLALRRESRDSVKSFALAPLLVFVRDWGRDGPLGYAGGRYEVAMGNGVIRPAIRVAFVGYTNDVFGLYTFGLFEVANDRRSCFRVSQGPTELKTSDGWRQDTNNVGCRVADVVGDEHVVVRWVGPGTNQV